MTDRHIGERAKLLEAKLTILQDVGSIQGSIGSTMSALTNLTSGSSSSAFDLMPGSGIKVPTTYDVLHGISAANGVPLGARTGLRKGQSGHFMHIESSPTINVYVQHEGDVPKVADAIDRVTGSQLHAKLRLAGMRGT